MADLFLYDSEWKELARVTDFTPLPPTEHGGVRFQEYLVTIDSLALPTVGTYLAVLDKVGGDVIAHFACQSASPWGERHVRITGRRYKSK